MRKWIVFLGAMSLLPGMARVGLASEPLVQWHFLGTARLAGNTNAAGLREICSMPSTRHLVEVTLQKLAAQPHLFFGGAVGTNSSAATQLRTLFNDLIGAESIGEFRGAPNQPSEWTMAVRLDETKATSWRGRWDDLLTAIGAGRLQEKKEGDFSGWEASRPSPQLRCRLARVGDWLVCGWGPAALPAHSAMCQRLKAGGVVGPAGDGWVDLQANLARLAPMWGWPAYVDWPELQLTAAGNGANLKTQGKLKFSEPLGLQLEKWHIPTNTIRDPLTSFTAAQGMKGWLGKRAWTHQLDLNPPPNQFFGWAMSTSPFETYFGFPVQNATGTLQRATPQLAGFVHSNFSWLTVGQLAVQTNTGQVFWQGLPIAIPFLWPASGQNNNFIEAGILPVDAPKRKPAPPELFAQVTGRTNLVYYDWEITEQRLFTYRQLFSYYSMMHGYRQAETNDVIDAWQMDDKVLKHLGNTVTELSVTSPRELTLLRSSTAGLTGFEFALLIRWLDNAAFPGYQAPELVSSKKKRTAPKTPGAPPPPAVKPATPRP